MRRALIVFSIALAIVLPLAVSPVASAAKHCSSGQHLDSHKKCVKNPAPTSTGSASTSVTANSADYDTGLPNANASGNELQHILETIVLPTLGALALLFIAIGALRYILAGDNPQDAARARDTIIYAAVGAIIILVAEALVAFVLDKL